MSDAMPAERDTVRGVSGLMIFLLTVAWFGGTIALFVAAIDVSLGVDCQIRTDDCLHADRLMLGSVACACGLPLPAALICAFTGRRFGAVFFFVLGISMALVYGRTFGIGAAREIHRLELPASVPAAPPSCPCYSGGSCDCPGG